METKISGIEFMQSQFPGITKQQASMMFFAAVMYDNEPDWTTNDEDFKEVLIAYQKWKSWSNLSDE